ncbi:MAG: WG repeat-containing protein [Blastocatellia bacterium]
MKHVLSVCLVLLACQMAAAQHTPVKVNQRWGYADNKGRLVIPPQFDIALPFIEGLARVAVTDKASSKDKTPGYRWGYIDTSGHIVVELQYSVLRDFSEGLAAAAVPNMDKEENRSYRDSLTHNLKWGYVDRNGQVVIPIRFLYAGDFSENLAPVDVGMDSKSMCARPSKFGYIDKTGAFVIEPAFAHAAPFQNGQARVSIGRVCYVGRCLCCAPRFFGSYGHIDRKGIFTSDDPTRGELTEKGPCFDN